MGVSFLHSLNGHGGAGKIVHLGGKLRPSSRVVRGDTATDVFRGLSGLVWVHFAFAGAHFRGGMCVLSSSRPIQLLTEVPVRSGILRVERVGTVGCGEAVLDAGLMRGVSSTAVG
jgi:hypothetical protein